LAPQFDYSSSVADETHTPAKSALLVKIVLTVTKRNSGQFTLPGFCRLLPQLVGSCDPGGEVGRMGAARIDLLDRRITAKSIRSISA
jgi:hypothetical protein